MACNQNWPCQFPSVSEAKAKKEETSGRKPGRLGTDGHAKEATTEHEQEQKSRTVYTARVPGKSVVRQACTPTFLVCIQKTCTLCTLQKRVSPDCTREENSSHHRGHLEQSRDYPGLGYMAASVFISWCPIAFRSFGKRLLGYLLGAPSTILEADFSILERTFWSPSRVGCFCFAARAQAESGGRPDVFPAVHQTWSRPAVRFTALAV